MNISEAYGNFADWVKDGAIGDDWTTTISKPGLLYNDASNTSQAASSIPNVNWPLGTIEPWKQIWLNRTNSKYWMPGSSEAAISTEVFNTTNGRKHGVSFNSQAPYIIVDPNDDPNIYKASDADVVVISPMVMNAVLNSNQYNVYDGMNVIRDWSTMTTEPLKIIEVKLNVNGKGTVTGAGPCQKGASVEISAIPAQYNKFVKWSDNNTEATRTLTVNSTIELTAYFSPTGEDFTQEVATFTEFSNGTVILDSSASLGEYLLVITTTSAGSINLNCDPFYTQFPEAGEYMILVDKQYGTVQLTNNPTNVSQIVVKKRAE